MLFNQKALMLWVAAIVLSATAALAQDGQLSTHILDINKGEPAKGVTIGLFKYDSQADTWLVVTTSQTDDNGRLVGLLPEPTGNNGIYKLRFEVAEYFHQQNQPSIYPFIEVVFQITGGGHYHIPLTLSANGFSTYRGS